MQIGENCSEVGTQLLIQEVDFVDNLVVEQDTQGDFAKPEWDSQRCDQYPIVYVRNKTVKLWCIFEVLCNPTSGESVEIRGKAQLDDCTLEWTDTVAVGPNDEAVATVEMTSSGTLPNAVGRYDPMDIDWEIKPPGRDWMPAGRSSTQTYVLLGKPAGVKHYWTLLDISCEGAHGKSSPKDVVAHAFEPLKTTLGDGAGRPRMRDGVPLTYWDRGLNTPQNFTTEALLSDPKGAGRCGAWARFFVDMCKLHGIATPKVFGVQPKYDRHGGKSMLVKTHVFEGMGSSPPPYTHAGLVDCKRGVGVAGQGKSNPLAIFPNHALVLHPGDGIYDPSYGIGPFRSRRSWEDVALDGIGTGGAVYYTHEGDPHYITNRCSRGFFAHRFAAGDTMSGIATQYGVSSGGEGLFAHPINAALRAQRVQSENVTAGDVVYIPRDGSTIVLLGL